MFQSLSRAACSVFVFLLLHVASSSETIGVRRVSRLIELQDRERAPPSVQIPAAYSVLRRLFPSHFSCFEFRIIPKDQCGKEYCFHIENNPSFIAPGDPEILVLKKGV